VVSACRIELHAAIPDPPTLHLKSQYGPSRHHSAGSKGNPSPNGIRTLTPAATSAWSTAASAALPRAIVFTGQTLRSLPDEHMFVSSEPGFGLGLGPGARSSVDRAPPSGGGSRRFKSCRARGTHSRPRAWGLRTTVGGRWDPAPRGKSLDIHRLEEAHKPVDKQERLLEDLRSRTGIPLAAALGAAFLGREALGGDPRRGLAIGALIALLIAIAGSPTTSTDSGGKTTPRCRSCSGRSAWPPPHWLPSGFSWSPSRLPTADYAWPGTSRDAPRQRIRQEIAAAARAR
jgi:hypothetical protein